MLLTLLQVSIQVNLGHRTRQQTREAVDHSAYISKYADRMKRKKEILRCAHAFEACKDGSLIIYAMMPDGDGEPIRVEPHRVSAVLAVCGDALARKPSTR